MKAVLNNIDLVLEKLSTHQNVPRLSQKTLETFFTRAMLHVGGELVKYSHPAFQHHHEFEVTLPFTDEMVEHGRMLFDKQDRTLYHSTIAELIDRYEPTIREFLRDAFDVFEITTYTTTKYQRVISAGVTFQLKPSDVIDRLRTYRQKLAFHITQVESEARLDKVLTYVEHSLPQTFKVISDSFESMDDKLNKLTAGVDRIITKQEAEPAPAVKERKPRSNRRDTPMSKRNSEDTDSK